MNQDEEKKRIENEYDESVKKLAEGLLELYQPKLQEVKGKLVELTKKQKSLEKELHQENLKLTDTQCSDELHDLINKIRIYKEKLIVIKKNMALIHERTSKLKKRALKLEQQKQKEALDKAQQREQEEQLIGKPSS